MNFRFLIPDWPIELSARIAGYFVRLFKPDSAVPAESQIRAKLMGLRDGHQARLFGRYLVFQGTNRLKIGKGVALHAGVQISLGAYGSCTLGDNTHISRGSVLAASGDIEIGKDCAISSGVIIYSVTYDRSEGKPLNESGALYSPVKIGDRVHIGAGVTILPGVTIGNDAVIGAGSVVTRNIEAGKTVAGVPARAISDEKTAFSP